MKIKVLGTRGEIEKSTVGYSRHSGVLVDNTILLDLGEKVFLNYKPISVFVTHLHPDHAFFINKGDLNAEMPVYAPQSSKRHNVSELLDSIHINSYQVKPIPTHHSKLVKSQAYLVDHGNQKLLYTGDLIWIDEKYHNLFKNSKLVITDGSFLRHGGMVRKDKNTGEPFGHNGIPDLIAFFKYFTRNILFVHFGSWFYKNIEEANQILIKLGKSYGIIVYVGYDGMELNLDQLR